jgi:ATPase subunit of ABC transporter with duplicated ATPase domains
MLAAISCSDLSFSWPDGQPVLSDVTMSIGPGRTGLIGTNGSGKSTLLRLFAGELRPASGVLRVTGEVGYLPQAITLGTHQTVADPAWHRAGPGRPACHRGRRRLTGSLR